MVINAGGSVEHNPCHVYGSVQSRIDRIIEPNYPMDARDQGATGSVRIKITLDATGSITGTSLLQSSGSSPLDRAALYAARQTTYHPTRFCARTKAVRISTWRI